MTQAALPFEWPAGEDAQDFIIGDANAAAVRHLDHWGTWPVMATILTGPRKSGRSLLGRLFARNSGGRLIDDADRKPEPELFHAWNAAQEQHRPLLLIADAAAPLWAARLPDLRSRLGATPSVAIGEPDDTLAAAILEKLLNQRNLFVPSELIEWLVPRIERTYVNLVRVIDVLDEAALSKRTRLSLRLARSALAEAGLADARAAD